MIQKHCPFSIFNYPFVWRFFMNPLYLNDPDPYMACHQGIDAHPLFMRCDICPNADWCDFGITELALRQSDQLLQSWHDQSFENREKYFIDNTGHWNSGDWRKVKKAKYLAGTSPRFSCYHGWAHHPQYLQCRNCHELSSCDFGKYRLSKVKPSPLDKVKNFLRKLIDNL